MLNRIMLGLGGVVLCIAGMLTISTYIAHPAQVGPEVIRVTGSASLALVLIWGPVPLGLYLMVRAARPRLIRSRIRITRRG